MGWRAVVSPAGPRRAAVYWRRRLVVLVVLVVVVLAGSRLARGGSPATAGSPAGRQRGAAPPAGATSAPAPSAPSPAPPASPAQDLRRMPRCPDSAVALHVSPDATSYPRGAQPVFTLTVTLSAGAACVRDLGASEQGVQVLLSGRRVWDSAACAARGSDLVVLTPGLPHVVTVTWNGRSAGADCAAADSRPLLGPGGYEVTANVGAVLAYGGAFRLR